MSTKSDVLATLRCLPTVDQESIKVGEGELLGHELTQVTWSSAAIREYNTAEIYQGVLIRLEFDANCKVTLGELVKRYGSPEGFRMNVGRGGVSLLVSYATSGFEASTEYVSRDISWGTRKSGILDVQPDLCLTRVYYFEPMPLEQALRRAYLEYNDTIIRRAVAGQQPWQGFGQVKVTDWE
jgi:hypothetical protein